MTKIEHEPLRPFPSGAPEFGQRWMHTTTGVKYVILDRVYIEENAVPAIVYGVQGDMMGVKWVRPVREFMEKFVRVSL